MNQSISFSILRTRFYFVIAVVTTSLLGTSCTHKKQEHNSSEPIHYRMNELAIIAHRGYPSKIPDHTLESYTLAAEAGADFIEPDLVITKDGILICRHENELSLTTNVADLFPKRKKEKWVDGVKVIGWFAEDFTLKEIKELRARQPLAIRDQSLNDKYSIPTFREFLQLTRSLTVRLKKPIGIYPELKHPTYFQQIRLPLEEIFLKDLHDSGFHHSENPVFIQSFEVNVFFQLKKLKHFSEKYKLMQLIGDPQESPFDQTHLPLKQRKFRSYEEMLKPDGLRIISKYAHGIAPWKKIIQYSPSIVEMAHQNKLLVHLYTFRSEPNYLEEKHGGHPENEYYDYFKLNIDGLFTDDTNTALRARRSFRDDK